LVLVAPWHILVSLKNPEFFDFYVIHEQFLRFFTTVHKRTQPLWFFIPVLLIGLFPWVVFLGTALKKTASNLHNRTAEGSMDGFLVLWATCMFIFFSLSQSKLIPYIVPILPPLSLLIGRKVAHAWKTRVRETLRGPLWFFEFVTFVLLIAIPVILKREGLWEHPSVAPYAIGIEIILLSGGLIAAVFYACHRVRSILVTLGATGALVMVTLSLTWDTLEGRSIKPLALELKKHVGPEDLVVSYHRYYQDLPPYSERTVYVVEYLGELEFGASQEPGHTPMIREADFADLLKKPQTLYIVTRKSFVKDLEKRHALNNLHILAQTDKDVLLVKRKK
jgi:4-amino-4-deoxy-L-arabinose transferase-like glycosyltransferase